MRDIFVEQQRQRTCDGWRWRMLPCNSLDLYSHNNGHRYHSYSIHDNKNTADADANNNNDNDGDDYEKDSNISCSRQSFSNYNNSVSNNNERGSVGQNIGLDLTERKVRLNASASGFGWWGSPLPLNMTTNAQCAHTTLECFAEKGLEVNRKWLWHSLTS